MAPSARNKRKGISNLGLSPSQGVRRYWVTANVGSDSSCCHKGAVKFMREEDEITSIYSEHQGASVAKVPSSPHLPAQPHVQTDGNAKYRPESPSFLSPHPPPLLPAARTANTSRGRAITARWQDGLKASSDH